MQQRLWRGASDEDVRAPDGGARGWWGANPASSRGSAGDAARDGRRPLRAHRDEDDDRGELSSGGESDDSRATVVTHGVGAHHGKSLSGVSSSGGDFASDAERGDGDFGRGRVAASHDRRGSLGSLGSGRLLNDAHLTIAGSAHVSPSLPGVGGSMTLSQGSISQSDVVLRRVDSKTHVVEALASVPGLHKRGIDLPMTKRLAFRKCRGVARNRGLLALALMLFVVAMTARRAPSRHGDDEEHQRERQQTAVPRDAATLPERQTLGHGKIDASLMKPGDTRQRLHHVRLAIHAAQNDVALRNRSLRERHRPADAREARRDVRRARDGEMRVI